MYKTPSLLNQLIHFENRLNQFAPVNVHYQVGYLSNSYHGPYYYVQTIRQVNDSFTTGFLLSIDQASGKLLYYDFVTRKQRQIIRHFKRSLKRQYRIGRQSTPFHMDIVLHRDIDGTYPENTLHPYN